MAIKLTWREYAVGLVVTYNIFIVSVSIFWYSPMQSILQNAETSPLGYALTDEEFAIINSVFLPVSVFGPLICSAMVSIMSCRQILLIALSTQLVGSILMAVALNMATLIVGRIILGFASGISASSVMILIHEMTSEETRGRVSTFITIGISTSLLYIYSLCWFSSYYVFNSVNVCIVAVHIVVMYFLPESPVYLMRKGDFEGAIKVLAQLRGRKVFDTELEILKPKAEEHKRNWINLRVFTDKVNLKIVFLASTLIGCQPLAGITIVIAYTKVIFEMTGSTLMPALALLIMAAIVFQSSIVISLIVGFIRRKKALIPAYVMLIMSTIMLGVYFKLDNDGWNVRSSWGLLPLTTILSILTTAITPITFATIGELTTLETKTAISTFSVTIAVTCIYLTLSLLNVMASTIGVHGIFFMSSGFGVLLLLIVIVMLPETKGKTEEEIRAQLS